MIHLELYRNPYDLMKLNPLLALLVKVGHVPGTALFVDG